MKRPTLPDHLAGSDLVSLNAFQGLALEQLDEIAEQGSIRSYARDAVVLKEGEAIEHYVVVLEGRLTVQHHGTVIAHLERGDTFGQLSLIAELPAMVTVVVRHDCRLLAVPRSVFKKVLGASPEFAAAVLKRSATRLTSMGSGARSGLTTVIAVYSAPSGVGKTSFAVNLAASLAREVAGDERVLLLDVATEKKSLLSIFGFGSLLPLVDLKTVEALDRDIAKEKGQRHEEGFELLRVAHRPDRGDDAEGVAPLLSTLSKSFRFLVLDLPPLMDATIWKFLTHADLCIVLSSSAPRPIDQTANLLGKLPGDVKVFITRATTSDLEERRAIEKRLGRRVDEFLEELPEVDGIALTRFPDARYTAAVRRTARLLLGRLVGLALSGGAARGTSHIGVLRVLEEEGIEPDIVAGTSIGSLVGSLWCAGRTAEELTTLARRIRRKDFFSIFDLAFPPSPALIRGSRVDTFVAETLGDLRFSDLRIPMRVVAADIDTAEEVVFDTGLVREAVRASIAIPGVLRPVIIDGRRLFDGAVVMPVPVEVLKGLGCGRVIAVNAIPIAKSMRRAEVDAGRMAGPDVSSTAADLVADPRSGMAPLPIVRELFDLSPQSIPNILDIIVRSNQYMQAEIAEQSCKNAAVVIRPWVPELSWMDFDSSARFIQAGDTAARAVLPALRRLRRP